MTAPTLHANTYTLAMVLNRQAPRYCPCARVIPLVGLTLFLLAACSVSEVDLTGKECPCPRAWRCDDGTNTCVRAGTGLDGSEEGADSGADASADSDALQDGDPGPPTVVVTNLRAAWTTPNWIRWEWESEGQPEAFSSYELTTAESEADAVARTGSAVVWTVEQNPELGLYLLSPAVSVIVSLTDGHAPSKQYYAQLVAFDLSGRRSYSNVAAARTANPPLHSVQVFSETDVGSPAVPGVVLSDRFPYEGTYHYDFVSTCSAGEADCFDTPGRENLSMDPFGISFGALSTTAFFQVALATDSASVSYASEAVIQFGTSQSPSYVYSGWTLRSGGSYTVYQIPLRAFIHDGAPLPHDALADGLAAFGFGGTFSDGSHTSFDEVRVRW